MKSGTGLGMAGLAGIVVALGASFYAMWEQLSTASIIATGCYIVSVCVFAFMTTGARMSSTARVLIVSLGPVPMAIVLMLALTYWGL